MHLPILCRPAVPSSTGGSDSAWEAGVVRPATAPLLRMVGPLFIKSRDYLSLPTVGIDLRSSRVPSTGVATRELRHEML